MPGIEPNREMDCNILKVDFSRKIDYQEEAIISERNFGKCAMSFVSLINMNGIRRK
jgi:hypothetical protein